MFSDATFVKIMNRNFTRVISSSIISGIMFSVLLMLMTCSVYSQDVTINPSLLDSIKKKEYTDWKLRNPYDAMRQYSTAKPISVIQNEMKRTYPYWVIYIFLFLLALITFVRVQYTKEFNEVFYVMRSNIITQQIYREAPSSGLRIAYFLLNLNFIIILGIWLLYIIKKTGYFRIYDDWVLLSAITALIILVMVLRYLFLLLASLMFSAGKEISYYNYNELQIFRCAGLILFPVLALLYFSPQPYSKIFFMFSLVIIGTFFLYRYLRGFEIGKAYFFRNIFHFLIYICTLEIAPILIGIRFVSNLLHQ
jgi:hypothetical protein